MSDTPSPLTPAPAAPAGPLVVTLEREGQTWTATLASGASWSTQSTVFELLDLVAAQVGQDLGLPREAVDLEVHLGRAPARRRHRQG